MRELNIVVRVNGNCESNEFNNLNITKLNLDVTTMMAFVSNMTCETCQWTFDLPILNEQARRERGESTKAFLDDLFRGNVSRLISYYNVISEAYFDTYSFYGPTLVKIF